MPFHYAELFLSGSTLEFSHAFASGVLTKHSLCVTKMLTGMGMVGEHNGLNLAGSGGKKTEDCLLISVLS